MAESKTSFILKILGLIVLASAVVTVLLHWIQMMLFGEARGGISAGAGGAVGAAIAFARRNRMPADTPKG